MIQILFNLNYKMNSLYLISNGENFIVKYYNFILPLFYFFLSITTLTIQQIVDFFLFFSGYAKQIVELIVLIIIHINYTFMFHVLSNVDGSSFSKFGMS